MIPFSFSTLGRRGRLGVLAALLLVLGTAGVVLEGGYYRAAYHLRAAREALEQRDYAEAESRLKRSLQLRPDSAEGHFLLARLARRAGRVDEAADHLKASQSLGWPHDAVHLESVLARIQQGQFIGQVEHYLRRRLDNRDPDSFLIYEALSQGYTKLYRLSEALACLNAMLEQQPDNVYALVRRGWVLERFEHFDEAENDYRRAVAVQGDHALARQRLAENLLLHAKIAAEAAEHFEALTRLRPDDVAAKVYLARCWTETDRLAEARSLLDQLLADHPREASAWIERGQVAVNEEQFQQAETWLRRGLELQPNSLRGNYALYLCLNRQGKSEEADRYLTRFQASEADSKRLAEVMKRVREAPDAALRYEAAQLFFRGGEDQEGEHWLFLALQADPTYRPAHEALAAYYERTGRPRPPNDVEKTARKER